MSETDIEFGVKHWVRTPDFFTVHVIENHSINHSNVINQKETPLRMASVNVLSAQKT